MNFAKTKNKELVYLAGSMQPENRALLEQIVIKLREEGYNVYFPFELKIPNAWDYSQEDWATKVFNADKEALDACKIFLMITPGRNGTAGTNWEQGYAYAKGKEIYAFQYTDDNTSLMTFCSSNTFVNTTKETIVIDIINTLEQRNNKSSEQIQKKCSTYLT